MGIVELACAVGVIVPAALRLQTTLPGVTATVLAVNSLVFIGVHAKCREIAAAAAPASGRRSQDATLTLRNEGALDVCCHGL